MSRILTLLAALLLTTGAFADALSEGRAALERGRHSRALALLTEAAEDDVREAQFLVGKMYLDGEGVERDVPTALHWLEQAAAQRYRPANMLLGKIYASGMGVPMDAEKSTAYLKAAAEPKEPATVAEDDADCE
ncbi:tetratricopeptide repeat protein [Endothiovibrio diazotrophicus]